jgi:hypothetical protein
MRNRSLISVLVAVWVLAAVGLAQSRRLSNDDIIRMAEAGLTAPVITVAINAASSVTFDTTPDGLIALKKASVPDSVIAVMVRRAASSPAAGAAGVGEGSETVEVSDGTPISIRLVGGTSSATARTGDAIRFSVFEDVRVKGALVVRRGARARGLVSEARKRGSFGRGGTLKFEVESIEAADGQLLNVRFNRDMKGGDNVGGAIDAATGAATGRTSRVIDSAAGQVLAKGQDVVVRAGTQYEVFITGTYQVAPAVERARRTR